MSPRDLSLFVLHLLGGLALFMFAIRLMTGSLSAAAGPVLRRLVQVATRGRWRGLTLGTLLGLLLHSSAATVLLVGFLNAGLLTLAQSIAPVLGANLGTTLSMQLISFKVGEYFFVPILAGTLLFLLLPRRPYDQAGTALVGFGLLFLGMTLMSDAVAPHRAMLQPWLATAQQPGIWGQLAALAVATLATVVIQSSGALIGILFALSEAGVFHSLDQIFPLVLGAHIGTCTTALLGSVGTSITARRGAVAHLLFNILNAALALALGPWLVSWVAGTADGLIRQTANLHTIVMLLGIVWALPLRHPFARLVEWITPSSSPVPDSSFLDATWLEKPEQAIYQAVRELQRVARVCQVSFRLNAQIMFRMDRNKLLEVRRNEDAVDEIQRAMRRFLNGLTSRYLSRRQSILLQHLNRCMIDIERIGDHNDNLADLAENRRRAQNAYFPAEAQALLFGLFEAADEVLKLVIDSLNPENVDFQAMARAILQARDRYAELSLNAKSIFAERIVAHAYPPLVGIFLSDYVAEFDRIVRHAKMIALVESQPWFWIKRQKLDWVAPEMPPAPDLKSEPHDFLDKLQSEGFV
jgi:phosphate:Na+ symporter